MNSVLKLELVVFIALICSVPLNVSGFTKADRIPDIGSIQIELDRKSASAKKAKQARETKAKTDAVTQEINRLEQEIKDAQSEATALKDARTARMMEATLKKAMYTAVGGSVSYFQLQACGSSLSTMVVPVMIIGCIPVIYDAVAEVGSRMNGGAVVETVPSLGPVSTAMGIIDATKELFIASKPSANERAAFTKLVLAHAKRIDAKSRLDKLTPKPKSPTTASKPKAKKFNNTGTSGLADRDFSGIKGGGGGGGSSKERGDDMGMIMWSTPDGKGGFKVESKLID